MVLLLLKNYYGQIHNVYLGALVGKSIRQEILRRHKAYAPYMC